MRRSPHTLGVALAAAALVSSAATARAEGAGSRWIAALPFGVGQIQNGDTGFGVFLAIGEALLGAASIATSVVVGNLAATDPAGVDVTVLNGRIGTLVAVNRAAFIGWAALSAGGVVEAEVSYGPRRDTRRALAPAVTAAVAPVAGGAVVGVRAQF